MVLAQALFSLVVLGAVMAALIFLPAGTVHYWQAWAFLAAFTGMALLVTLDLARRDPALLRRRLKGGPTAEKQTRQRVIQLFASIGFISLLVIPGFDRRYGWSAVPPALAVLGDVLLVLGFGLVGRVYRENSFTSATIEVAEDQRVISTGPYARVRHPMYASSLVYLLGMPVALASWWGYLGLAFMLPFLLWRLLDEERFLARRLPGYEEYQRKVKYRLLPHVW